MSGCGRCSSWPCSGSPSTSCSRSWATSQDSLEAIVHADPPWLVGAVLASILTYAAAAIQLQGAVPERLNLAHTIEMGLASSFANRLTPASIGGVATDIRYLQRGGLEYSVAGSSYALNSATGLVVHVFLLVCSGVIVGKNGVGAVKLPVRLDPPGGGGRGTGAGRRRAQVPEGAQERAPTAAGGGRRAAADPHAAGPAGPPLRGRHRGHGPVHRRLRPVAAGGRRPRADRPGDVRLPRRRRHRGRGADAGRARGHGGGARPPA